MNEGLAPSGHSNGSSKQLQPESSINGFSWPSWVQQICHLHVFIKLDRVVLKLSHEAYKKLITTKFKVSQFFTDAFKRGVLRYEIGF